MIYLGLIISKSQKQAFQQRCENLNLYCKPVTVNPPNVQSSNQSRSQLLLTLRLSSIYVFFDVTCRDWKKCYSPVWAKNVWARDEVVKKKFLVLKIQIPEKVPNTVINVKKKIKYSKYRYLKRYLIQ